MRKLAVGAAAVVFAWALSARAETIDEALERLVKAAEGVKDLTSKSDMVMNATNPMTKAPMKIVMAMDMQVLNEGGKRLFRVTNQMSQEGALPGGAKMQMTTLMVFDGEIAWMENRNPMMPQPMVVKMKMESLGNIPGMQSSAGLQDMRAAVAQMKTMFDLKLAGTGSVMGRATTRIEATPKPETIEKMPEMMRANMPARLITDYDDATGTPLVVKAFNAQGGETLNTVVTDLKVNAGVDKALFTYTPPPGVQVQDMTGKSLLGPGTPAPPQ